MVRFASCCALILLAACPKKGTPSSVQVGGCPSASGVFIASYVSQEAGKGRSGWVLPLHAAAADGTQVAEYTSIDAEAARAAGVPAAPSGVLWLQTASGTPCQARLGNYYAAKIDGPPASVSYGVELDGCAAPNNPDDAGGVVLVAEQAPTGCRFEVPQPVAGRLGTMDAQKKWQRPTKESPLPPALAAALPQKPCAAPDCETLWAFAEVKVGDQTVAWTGAINWLDVRDPDQCSWQPQSESGFWIPTDGGATKVSEGQEHPLPLIAVLADGNGARVALAEANGRYATYDLSPGRATLGHRVTWMLAPPEAWQAIDDLGPICDEDRD